MENKVNFLATRSGFNYALNHFKTALALSDEVAEGYNLADLINEALDENEIKGEQVRPIINALLVDKFDYAYRGVNLPSTISDASAITSKVVSWKKLQIIVTYSSPDKGLQVVNPAEPSQFERVLPLVKGEFCSVFVGSNSIKKREIVEQGASDVAKLIEGKSVKNDSLYKGGVRKQITHKAPATTSYDEYGSESSGSAADTADAGESSSSAQPVPEAPPVVRDGSYRTTPKYSVVVTNELFHNGNVEAWKRIINSYVTAFPGNEVLVWYDNEKINDINSLFKWGKVKSGTPIIFSVGGSNIGGVSKLQRYLFEGASPRFEAFLKGSLHQTLNLF